jgi:ribosomal protein L11 methylase PrmA
MENEVYRRWWQLHLRVAKGETLDPTEQVEYEAGLKALDQEEEEQFEQHNVLNLRRLRAQIEQLRLVHSQLLARSARLDEQIAALEEAYRSLTGYELAGEPYASS